MWMIPCVANPKLVGQQSHQPEEGSHQGDPGKTVALQQRRPATQRSKYHCLSPRFNSFHLTSWSSWHGLKFQNHQIRSACMYAFPKLLRVRDCKDPPREDMLGKCRKPNMSTFAWEISSPTFCLGWLFDGTLRAGGEDWGRFYSGPAGTCVYQLYPFHPRKKKPGVIPFILDSHCCSCDIVLRYHNIDRW